jgi:hypothetical protein
MANLCIKFLAIDHETQHQQGFYPIDKNCLKCICETVHHLRRMNGKKFLKNYHEFSGSCISFLQ